MAARVLVSPDLHGAGLAVLTAEADVAVVDPDDRARFLAELAKAEVALIRRPAEILATDLETATNLRAVIAQGSGVDNIPIDEAAAMGIAVANTAGTFPEAVAEYVVGAMIVAHRRMFQLSAELSTPPNAVEWAARTKRYAGFGLGGTTVGIIGCGHIGREVARMLATAFGSRVLGFDPYAAGTSIPQVELVDSLDDLLDASTTVSVNAPLTDETRGLLGFDELRRIGPDGVLVNAGRGAIIDQAGLIRALSGGHLKAAVIDTFETEPPGADQLASLANVPNLVMTPHVAGITAQSLARLSVQGANAVLSVLRGELPPGLLNDPRPSRSRSRSRS